MNAFKKSYRLLMVCLMLAAFQYANAQQRYYYQKTNEIVNGEEASFPDSERKTKCLIVQGNTCYWEDECVDEWNFGQYSRKPVLYNFIRNDSGNRVYQYSNNSWTCVLSITGDYSQVYKNTYYPSTGDRLTQLFQRVSQ